MEEVESQGLQSIKEKVLAIEQAKFEAAELEKIQNDKRQRGSNFSDECGLLNLPKNSFKFFIIVGTSIFRLRINGHLFKRNQRRLKRN